MSNENIKEIGLEQLIPLIKESLNEGKSVWFSPSGNSMLPMLRHKKDSVELLAAPDKLRKYDIILYQRENGNYILHRIVKVGDTYTCCGDHQFKYEKGIRHSQIIGYVIGFSVNGKTHSIREPGYKLYCRFWLYRRKLILFIRRAYRWWKRHFNQVK